MVRSVGWLGVRGVGRLEIKVVKGVVCGIVFGV